MTKFTELGGGTAKTGLATTDVFMGASLPFASGDDWFAQLGTLITFVGSELGVPTGGYADVSALADLTALAAADRILVIDADGVAGQEARPATPAAVVGATSIGAHSDVDETGAAAGLVLKRNDANDGYDLGTVNGVAAGDQAKLDNITVTQAVDLDALKTGLDDVASMAALAADQTLPLLDNYASGAGLGDASADQAAWVAAAAAGDVVRLRANTTYYATANVAPVTGFGVVFEPGAKVVLVTQAPGSGNAGFKNYSGLDANRNGATGIFLSLTASGGTYVLHNPHFEGDNNNQPIVRPVFAQDCTLHIFGQMKVRNLNAVSGAASLNEMLGGTFEDIDVAGNAEMDDSNYTDLTNYSPAAVIVDDRGTYRSEPLAFGRVFVKDLNREAAGADPRESDGVTLGGIDKPSRPGSVHSGGHYFGLIAGENVGELIDIQQNDCYVGMVIGRNLHNCAVKLIHGARRNTIQHYKAEDCGVSAIILAGSTVSSFPTEDNFIGEGECYGIGANAYSTADSCVVSIQNSGQTVAARNNKIKPANYAFVPQTHNSNIVADYVVRDNTDVGAAGNIAGGQENRVLPGWDSLGSDPAVSFLLAAQGKTQVRLALDEDGSYVEGGTGLLVKDGARSTLTFRREGRNAANEMITFAQVLMRADVLTDGVEDGFIDMKAMEDGTLRSFLTLTQPSNNETAMSVRIRNTGTPTFKRVKFGAADSGGSGLRALVIDN